MVAGDCHLDPQYCSQLLTIQYEVLHTTVTGAIAMLKYDIGDQPASKHPEARSIDPTEAMDVLWMFRRAENALAVMVVLALLAHAYASSTSSCYTKMLVFCLSHLYLDRIRHIPSTKALRCRYCYYYVET
jgi:hypothetical protein